MKKTKFLSLLLVLLLVFSGCGAGNAGPGPVSEPQLDEGPATEEGPAEDLTAADVDGGLMPYVGVWERGDGLVRIRVNGDHSWEKSNNYLRGKQTDSDIDRLDIDMFV